MSAGPEPATEADTRTGLSVAEVERRRAAGQVNRTERRSSRSIADIVRANVFTRFNAIITVLAGVVLIFGHPIDALFAGVMVIEVANSRARAEHPNEPRAIHVERHVEHRELVARRRFDSLEQGDVALDAGDERCVGRIDEAKLLERAKSVRVAVEYIVAGHQGPVA